MNVVLRVSIALLCAAIAPANAAHADQLDVPVGKALFDRLWIPAPASTKATDGLGPLFSSRSCTGCHARGEGARVVTREDGQADIAGAVVRFGKADGTTDPYYGLQLQTNAVPKLMPEGEARFLPSLQYKLTGPPLADGVHTSARLAPPLFGRGAFDDVADEEILKRADPDDRNGDGIKGRANITPRGIGRYGWKAAHVTLDDQIAHAFAIDIGLSSPKMPFPNGDCTKLETECAALPNGESAAFDGREISTAMLGYVKSYIRTLRAPDEAADSAGASLFAATGCAQCHVPALTTRDGRQIPAFTDLLLHDMGPGLDDGVGEPGVKSSEWRTAPLIGHRVPAEQRRFLHDGSAATVEEAIGKHGGEAERSRDLFVALSPDDKKRLVDYVNGL